MDLIIEGLTGLARPRYQVLNQGAEVMKGTRINVPEDGKVNPNVSPRTLNAERNKDVSAQSSEESESSEGTYVEEEKGLFHVNNVNI